MAMAKLAALILLLAFVTVSTLATTALASQYQLEANRYGPGSLKSYQCSSECARRCKQTQYKKPCLFFCNKCCTKCLCVPPGYYGNKGVCPCYNNWKTKRGGPKCP
ncbi:hypothetical protein CDL12_20563 [Handroanthus impetiginosus]|uniref:Gibberellin regulated protein n=1 Tax=Handroanthus impetiginosus TaxID=429701 RepID=A0A2G9GNT6_9LAMI|nr:hypothetical protein CDL12_20563 [Handroanthus impetiginosus]